MIDYILAALGYIVAIATILIFGMVLTGISPTIAALFSGIVMIATYMAGAVITLGVFVLLWAMTFGVWK